MKKGDQRRDELMATAERLFYTKGYEGTSVQDILTEMNFSKGGFYHHFDSKLAVLEAICGQRAQETCDRAREAAAAQQGGIKSVALAAMDPAPARYYHTRGDTADNLDIKTFEAGIKIMLETVFLFDEQGLCDKY